MTLGMILKTLHPKMELGMKLTFERIVAQMPSTPVIPYEKTYSNIVLLESLDNLSLPPEAIKDGLAELAEVIAAQSNAIVQQSFSDAFHSYIMTNIIRFGANEWMRNKLDTPVNGYIVGAPRGMTFMTLLCNPHLSHEACQTMTDTKDAFLIFCCVRTIVVAVNQQSPGWRLHVRFLLNFSWYIDSVLGIANVLEDSDPVSLFDDEWASFLKLHYTSLWGEQTLPKVRSMFVLNKNLSLKARTVWAAVDTTHMERLL